MKDSSLCRKVLGTVAVCLPVLAHEANAFTIQKDNTSITRDYALNKQTIYSYNDSVKNAIKAVVNITTESTVADSYSPFNDPFFRQFFGDMAPQDKTQGRIGSGVIIQDNGYIVTNSHVVSGADKINVIIPGDNKKYRAKLIGSDQKSDIAVIKIDKRDLPTITFADSSKYMVGDIVFAIGNPFGVGESITQGIISALDKHGFGISSYENFIQTDASINPGNSGGALIDTRGYLIGMNTAIISKTGGNHGIGFAIPSNMVKSIAEELVKNGKVTRGFLGVSIKDVDGDISGMYGSSNGALVVGIEANSPAQKGGLQVWDLVTMVNDKQVKNATDLRNKIGEMRPNERVVLTVVRNSQVGKQQKRDTKKISIVLADQKQEHPQSKKEQINNSQDVFDGLGIDNISKQIRSVYRIPKEIDGVFVSSVKNNSRAKMLGFEKGDVISQIEDYKIKDVDDFKRVVNELKDKPKRILVYNMVSGEIKTIIGS